MRTLILSDVHGNLPALDAVLAEPHDAVLCLGDLVGTGPEPGACVERIRSAGATVVQGNHDRGIAHHEPPGGPEPFRSLAQATALIAYAQVARRCRCRDAAGRPHPRAVRSRHRPATRRQPGERRPPFGRRCARRLRHAGRRGHYASTRRLPDRAHHRGAAASDFTPAPVTSAYFGIGFHMPQRPSHMPPTSRATRASRAMPLLATLTVAIAGCGPTPPGRSAAYQPRTREITVTTVPLLVKEAQAVYPFLKSDFAKGGMLEGKEVYAFSPSTIIVVEGDTIHFTLVNPEDDLHSFVLPDLAVALPGQRVTNATYVARRSGIYPIVCSVPSHLPMMWGQLLVLPAAAMGATVPGATTGEAGGKR